jgi:hypothetical protein
MAINLDLLRKVFPGWHITVHASTKARTGITARASAHRRISAPEDQRISKAKTGRSCSWPVMTQGYLRPE